MTVQERWDAKLVNWALWVVSGEPRGKCSILDFGSARYRFDFRTRPPQPLIGEALDTDRLIAIVRDENPEQHLAIRAWYVWTGTQADRCATLKVPYTTWRDRVIAARFRLEELAILRRRTVARPRQLALAG